MKTWDAIVIGAGVIGLSVGLELNKLGLRTLVVERSEPGRESSHAAGGMLAIHDPHLSEVVRPLAAQSVALYREFVHELHDETGFAIDFRSDGTIFFPKSDEKPPFGDLLDEEQLRALEPDVLASAPAYLLPESSVDPRHLVEALAKSLHHRQVDIVTGSPVVSVESESRRVTGVRTERSLYTAPFVVNCTGAWSTFIPPVSFQTRPVKGQMLSIVPAPGKAHFTLRHVVRRGGCYLIPRSDGKIVIGATVEEAGFDKRVQPDVIQRLHQQAAYLVPSLGEAKILEAWTGLRPGTPDNLPMIGETSYRGYLAATGHYRDGIMLAPITARIIGQLVTGRTPQLNLVPFSPERFG